MAKLLWVVVLVLSAPCASGQLFSFTRSPFFPNLLTFMCEDVNGPVSNPLFFRNGLSVTVIPDTGNGYLFNINRMLEGNFSCGSTNRPSSNGRRIVAYPDNMTEFINGGPFHGEVGSTIRLDCSITPGVLVEQYYVTWRSASDPSRVFFRSFPPHLNFAVINRDRQRYSVDPRNFSLSIQIVTPADGAQDYVCVLGVEDPLSMSRPLIYSHTENVNLSVIISMVPVIMKHPEDKVAISSDTLNFTCTARSSPENVSINWFLNNTAVDLSRHSITYSVRREAGSVMSSSAVTFNNVSGYDSGLLKCHAGNTPSREAKLDVLDSVKNLIPIALESGGFLYEVELKAPLQIPVRLVFMYSEVGSDELIANFTSREQFFNTILIRHVEDEDRVPFDSFRVRVALEYKENQQREPLIGPSYGLMRDISRADTTRLNITSIPAGHTTVTIALVSTVAGVLLVVLVIVLVILYVFCKSDTATLATGEINAKLNQLLARDVAQHPPEDGNQRSGSNSAAQNPPEDGNQRSGSDSAAQNPPEDGNQRSDSDLAARHPPEDGNQRPLKNNGFDKNTGKKYVTALVKKIRFAEGDKVLSGLLKEELRDKDAEELRDKDAEEMDGHSPNEQMEPPGVKLEAAIPIEQAPSSPTKFDFSVIEESKM